MTQTQLSLTDATLRRLDLPDATVSIATNVYSPVAAMGLLTELADTTPWRREQIAMFGKRMLQPRLIAWYGDDDAHYTYSGVTLTPMPWTKTLTAIKQQVEDVADAQFNSVLLNYYRNGEDSMGMHSDDEPELGGEPVIASLSLGVERPLILKHRHNRTLPTVRLPLPSGSVLIMAGVTQTHWRHGINKSKRITGARINLTFRRVVSCSGAQVETQVK